jgi:DNA-binding Xre family transcriptional regulator
MAREPWTAQREALDGLRRSARLTHQALADLAGLSKWTVYRLCTGGVATMTTDTAERLSRALGVSPRVIAIPPRVVIRVARYTHSGAARGV